MAVSSWSTVRRAVSVSYPMHGLISTLQPSPSSWKQAIACSKVGTLFGRSAARVSTARRSTPVVRLSDESCITIGTLSAVAGIAIAIDGGFEFNRNKVFTGIAVIVVSTIFYIVMIFVPDEDKA